jgi:hypothetical protein
VHQTSSDGASTATTSQVRVHRTHREWFRPRKRTPGAAASAPPSHVPERHSWLHSPVRRTSEITRHTSCTAASTTTATVELFCTLGIAAG